MVAAMTDAQSHRRVQTRMATRSQSLTQGGEPRERDSDMPTPSQGQHQEDDELSIASTDKRGNATTEIERRIESLKAESDQLRNQIKAARRNKEAMVRARIKELEQREAEKARLLEELAELMDYEIGQPRARRNGTDSPRPATPRGSKRRRDSHSTSPRRNLTGHRDSHSASPGHSPTRRGTRETPKFRDLPTYHGKGLKDSQSFINGAEQRFRIDGGARYPDHQSKIDYCVLAFAPGPSAKWKRYERRQGLKTTWEQFKTWMKDSIMDPTNRVLESITSYNGAHQRDTQTAEDFAAYLDVLELELGIDDDFQRRNNLFAKLRREIRTDILKKSDIPKTRQGLLSLATQIENTNRLTGGPAGLRQETGQRTEPHQEGSSGARPTPPRAGPASGVNLTSTGGGQARRRKGECSSCGSTEHRMAECPTVLCFKCEKKGHIAPNCPQLTGNDGSRR